LLKQRKCTRTRIDIYSRRGQREAEAKAEAYNTYRAPQAATATSEALVMSQAKLASLRSQADS